MVSVGSAVSETGSRGSGLGSTGSRSEGTVVAFELSGTLYGLDAGIAREVIAAETFISVPMTPPAILGLYNLRGTPLPMIDPYQLLDLPGRTPAGEGRLLLSVNIGGDLVGLAVDRVDAVHPYDPLAIEQLDATEHDSVLGIVRLEGGSYVTLLDPGVLDDRLAQLASG